MTPRKKPPSAEERAATLHSLLAGEHTPAERADLAYRYAWGVLKGRWPEGEPLIVSSPGPAAAYAKYVLGGRWPEAEPVIKTRSDFAYWYARKVLGYSVRAAEQWARHELGEGVQP